LIRFEASIPIRGLKFGKSELGIEADIGLPPKFLRQITQYEIFEEVPTKYLEMRAELITSMVSRLEFVMSQSIPCFKSSPDATCGESENKEIFPG